MFIPKPKRKDFKTDAEFKQAMEEFNEALKAKKGAKKFTVPTVEHTNAPVWHGADTALGKDVGSISFNHRVGLPFIQSRLGSAVGFDGTSEVFDNAAEYGIAVYDLESTLPKTSDDLFAGSLMNQVMNKMNMQIRKANAGAKNYEPVDLMIYELAYSDCSAFYASMCRIYGGLLTFEKRNAYLAPAYVEALGGDYNDLRNQMPEFRAYLKSFATRLNALTAIDLPYLRRKIVLCSNTYKDEMEGLNCQIYVPRFRSYYIYTVNAVDGGSLVKSNNSSVWSSMEYFQGDCTHLTLDAIRELGDYMLEQLLTDADISTISGDILKRYEGTGNLINLSWIDENYEVYPVYDLEFLEQFENCTMVPAYNYCYGGDPDVFKGLVYNVGGGTYLPFEITQSQGKIVQNTSIEFDDQTVNHIELANFAAPMICTKVVNFRNGEVDPSRLICATRLLATYAVSYTFETPGSPSDSYYADVSIKACDTEVVTQITVYSRVNDDNTPYEFTFDRLSGSGANADEATRLIRYSSAMGQFGYLPAFQVINSSVNTDFEPSCEVAYQVRNIDKAATITAQNVDAMIECSAIYEFGLNEEALK